ncbi:hypothetical protein TrVE_jg2497 [Triparma verrucosa]|uniref:Cilia- and flagella-associated protein 36 n=1 Tax=Triparma verrucosa TaxID=1606542 RepID=A0A9W7BVX2_9STRA|nr:hypothetical protein TrVE_jg2497 [Triparma verrucosa]
MDTVWAEALDEYLTSEEWYSTIGVFIESHCSLFEGEEEYGHGHWNVYKEFVEISEQILNNMLSNLGGDLDSLEKALDEAANTEARGPRDDARKRMVDNLLTFDSFPHFCAMMESKNKNTTYYESQPTPYFDNNDLVNLESMGFPKKNCVEALNHCNGDFDSALQYLFDHPPPSPRSEQGATPSAPPVMDMRQTRSKQPKDSQKEVEDSISTMKKKDEAAKRRRNSTVEEIAQADTEASDSNNESKRMERQLDHMFKRRDELVTEIKDQRATVVNYTKGPGKVSDDSLEELYLFLKEMVHNGEDLGKHKDKIHSYVFARITPDQGTLVPNLLNLMLLEGEDFLLQRNINRLLNGESLAAVLSGEGEGEEGGGGGEADEGGLDFNELDELHKQHAFDLENAKNALDDEAARQRRAMQEKLKNRRKQKIKECRDNGMMGEEINRIERNLDEENATKLYKLDASLKSRNQQMLSGMERKQMKVVEEVMRLNRMLTPEELENLDEQTAEALRQQHARDLAKMRESLQNEKNRQRAALQARLRAKRARALNSSPPPDGDDINSIICNIDNEETNGLNEIDSKFSRQMYAMVQQPTEWFAAAAAGARIKKLESDDEDWMNKLGELHKHHCGALSRMQASLADEKSRQHNGLQSRLQQMRLKKIRAAMKRGASAEEIEEIEEECLAFGARCTEKLESKFNEQQNKIAGEFMLKHDQEMRGVGDSTSIEQMINSEDIFDYEAAARALRANHERDVEANGKVRDEERRRQEDALKARLRGRKKKKKKAGAGDDDSDREEAEALKLLNDQFLLEDYVETGVNRGVVRVLKTRGGTRTLTTEEEKEVAEIGGWDNMFAGGEGGGEEEKGGDGGEEEEKGGEEEKGADGGEGKSMLAKHSEATKVLIKKLQGERRTSHQKLQERLRAKREAKMKELTDGGADEDEIAGAIAELEEEAVKERIQNDRILTLDEHKAIEEYEFGENGGALGGNLNTYELLDEIHSEFKDEREKLQQAMMEEKQRQKEEMKKARKEKRKEKKRRASVLLAAQAEEAEEEKNDKNLEDEVQRIMEEEKKERQTLSMMMNLEQARQKEALQKRLLKKRAQKRRNSIMGGSHTGGANNTLPPIDKIA